MNTTPLTPATPLPLERPSGRLYTVKEFCAHNHMPRSTFYKHLKAGKIRAVKIGARTMVPESELEGWIYRLDQPDLFPRTVLDSLAS